MPRARPITARIDGRSSALRALTAGEPLLMGEAAVQYLERSPDYALGMMAGYEFARRQLWQSRGTWTLIRNLTDPAA